MRDAMVVVRGLIRFAIKRGLIGEDPAKAYQLPPGPSVEIVVFTPAEMAHLRADPEPGMADVWLFFAHSCLRAQEFVWLLRADVALDGCGQPKAVRVRKKVCPATGKVMWAPKHGRERVVPLTPGAAAIVRRALATPLPGVPGAGELPGAGGWLFGSPVARGGPDERWTYLPLLKRLHRRLDSGGFKRRGLHAFRHTGATYLANDARMPLAQLQKFLGHKSLTTTQRYLHPQADDIAGSLSWIDLDGLIGGTKDNAASNENEAA